MDQKERGTVSKFPTKTALITITLESLVVVCLVHHRALVPLVRALMSRKFHNLYLSFHWYPFFGHLSAFSPTKVCTKILTCLALFRASWSLAISFLSLSWSLSSCSTRLRSTSISATYSDIWVFWRSIRSRYSSFCWLASSSL